MLLPIHDFRSHVARRSTCIIGVILPKLPRYSQICDPQISLRVQYQIFRFDIPVDDLILMHVIESNEDIGNKKFGLFFIEVSFVSKVVPQITTV